MAVPGVPPAFPQKLPDAEKLRIIHCETKRPVTDGTGTAGYVEDRLLSKTTFEKQITVK